MKIYLDDTHDDGTCCLVIEAPGLGRVEPAPLRENAKATFTSVSLSDLPEGSEPGDEFILVRKET